MSEFFDRRLDADTSFEVVAHDTAAFFRLGDVRKASLIEIGFEDMNIDVQADERWVLKIFSKDRSGEEVKRYVSLIEAALAAGVNHPALAQSERGGTLFVNGDIRAIATKFIDGKSFYQAAPPNEEELALIAREAVKINQISYAPKYNADSWSVSEFSHTFATIQAKIATEDLALIEKARRYYDTIDFEALPKTFVHGDIIKSNVIIKDGQAYVFDFACANVYPRIQELAVMAANLLADGETSLETRVSRVQQTYEAAGGTLTDIERDSLYNYAAAAVLMEFVGSLKEETELGETNEEILYWKNFAKQGLLEVLAEQA